MKNILDWQSPEVVNIFDETSLWSAPFGRLLLENIPMKPGATVLDVGFGCGYPLIELSQLFGETSKIYGIDIWAEAINRAKEKIRVLGIKNIEIIEQSATSIPLEDGQVNLVTSNLGVNNFEEKEKVYTEIHRVLRSDGSLCITTNPIGTFEELFQVFESIMLEWKWETPLEKLKEHIAHRKNIEIIEEEFAQAEFKLVNSKVDKTKLRFVNAATVLDHSLIRFGFRSGWESWMTEENKAIFFQEVIKHLDQQISDEGVFKMSIPLLYLEFQKKN